MTKDKQVENILRETLVIGNEENIPIAVEKLMILFNNEYCECDEDDKTGETTEWVCHQCGRVVKEIR